MQAITNCILIAGIAFAAWPLIDLVAFFLAAALLKRLPAGRPILYRWAVKAGRTFRRMK